MDLIEVDPVGPEAAEAVFDCVEDVPARGASVQRSLSDRPDEFRRDDHVLAPVSERRPEELLAARATVDIRRIEQCHSQFERAVHDGRRLLLVDPHPEVVAAEARDRDWKA